MKRNDFLKHFNVAIKHMLKNKGVYYFGVYEAPEDNDEFLKYCNYFSSFRADYKDLNWIDYDEDDKKIFLNNDCCFDEMIYQDNLIVDYIDALNPNEYEYAASLMVKKLLGNITLGKNYNSRDEGIDFYGFYSSHSTNYSKFLNIHTWYIGQVKCYKDKIKTNHLRELLGTIVLAKNGIWALDGRYSNKLEVKNYDHIIPMFVAKGYYSADSLNLAKKYNIKLFDNLDLIFWLIVLYEKDLEKLKKDLQEIKKVLS